MPSGSSVWTDRPTLTPRDPGLGLPRVHIEDQPVRLGRDSSCDIVIPEVTVSRKHARLSWDGNELVLEDLGSSGGTFLNGAKVQRCEVRPGDVIRLGPRVEFAVETEMASSSSLGRIVSEENDNETVRHLQMLLETARALNAATVLEEVLDVVLQAVVRLTKADRGCVVLVGADGTRTAAATLPPGEGGSAWAERSSLLDRAIRARKTTVADGAASPTTSMMVRGIELAAATPLVVTRRPLGPVEDASFIASVEVMGGILVERHAMGETFSKEDLSVFESLAAEAAVAIDSARLYREARDKAKIEHEMSLARGIQTALLQQPPAVAFAEVFAFSGVARMVGGDLYHTIVRPDGALALAVGDVSGKGIAASLIMAMVQGLLGLLHDLEKSVPELIPVLDRTLRRHNPGNKFLTLAAALLSPDGRLELVNAGHCPVVVLRSDGSQEVVERHGPVLGLLPVASWGSAELRLAVGDVIVLYSDGIAESFSPTGEEFGVEGVKRALTGVADRSAGEIGTALLEAASSHRGGREADDDVTVLVVRFEGDRAPKLRTGKHPVDQTAT